MNFQRQKIALETIVRKEVGRFIRIWPQTLLPPLINQSLYFIIFGGFIGSQISEIKGISYMSYLVPGLIMMGIISNSFANVVSSFFSSKFMHNVEEMIVASVSNTVILMGYIFGGMLRGLLVGLLIWGMSIFFVQTSIAHPLYFADFASLTALLFALAGFLNALFAKKFDDISIFQTFILTPLTYFGGVFYSIDHLPTFWQTISKLNPILYMVDGFRYGFYGIHDLNPAFGLSFLMICCLLFIFFNLWLMRRGYGLKS